MKSLFLLIVLTQNGAGDINAAFVNTETLQQCQQKALMVKDVFEASTIPVIESRCVQSELRFSEFVHASASSLIRHFYVIRLGHEKAAIKKMPDWKSCMLYAQQDVSQYCASSVQALE